MAAIWSTKPTKIMKSSSPDLQRGSFIVPKVTLFDVDGMPHEIFEKSEDIRKTPRI